MSGWLLNAFCITLLCSMVVLGYATPPTCLYTPNFHFGNNTARTWCCEYHSKKYNHHQWYTGRRYLTNYLENMKAWNCSEFHEECQNPKFNLTMYNQMVYEHFCNYQSYKDYCLKPLQSILSAEIDLQSNWTEGVKRLNTSNLDYKDLFKPCVQVAIYESQKLQKNDNFYEIIRIAMPTCGFMWQGFDAATIEERNITPWNVATVKYVCYFVITFITAPHRLLLVRKHIHLS